MSSFWRIGGVVTGLVIIFAALMPWMTTFDGLSTPGTDLVGCGTSALGLLAAILFLVRTRWAVTGALVAFSLVAYTAWSEFDIIRVLAEERSTWDDGPTAGYGLTVTLVAGVVGAVLALLAQESLERETPRTWVCCNCGHARECTACGCSYTVPRY